MNLNIDALEDREPLYCKMDDNRIINITGEGGSGKTTYSNKYKNNQNYIVVDYDNIILGNCSETKIEFYIRKKLKEKYDEDIFKFSSYDEARKNFTTIYEEIINILQNDKDKTIVLDGTQLRFIEDVKKIKGELIILRPSIETCITRSVNRKKKEHPELSTTQLKDYETKRRKILYELNPLLNELINKIAEFKKFEKLEIGEPKKEDIN